MWQPGQKLIHPYNSELGVGIVQSVEGRLLQVYFPRTDQTLLLSSEGSGLTRLVLGPGQRAEILDTGEEVEIAARHDSMYILRDGRQVEDEDLWPLAPPDTPLERLASLRLDRLDAFRNRIDGMRLMELRETGGFGSFLGGRIELFAHQLHVARQAVASDPVRWLLAEEVGLGKTIEACLILSALIRTGRTKRVLIVAPESLVVQWLGELYRKFHQIFVLLDRERIESVSRDYGEGVNPFEVHPYAVVAHEELLANPSLRNFADEAGLDLIVVDEAHRLSRDSVAQALTPLIRVAKHLLLLTATPLQADRAGFFQLLTLLHPDAFSSCENFEHALQAGRAVIPCTSSVRRQDIGGLPPRVPLPVDLEFLAPSPTQANDLASVIKNDPRTRWLRENAKAWRKRSEKALVFVHDVHVLLALQRYLEAEIKVRVFVFHEKMSTEQRDIDLAMFRESTSTLLLCSEAGEEGRNFQFCRRMVHYDLPTSPAVLEQRIGRLDRIGRKDPVEIVYFRRKDQCFDLAKTYEALDLFATPGAGLELALVNAAPIFEAALAQQTPNGVDDLVAEVLTARAQSTETPLQVYYRDGYTAKQEQAILADIPVELEKLTQRFCLEAARDLGFAVIEKSGVARFYIEIGALARIDSLPGVSGGARLLGTFDRSEAIHCDELEFFASGHPLVEGLLLELEDGPRGRAVLMDVPQLSQNGAGLLAVAFDSKKCHAVILDTAGKPRPEWLAPLWKSLPFAKPVSPTDWNLSAQWAESVRKLGARLPTDHHWSAVAFFRFVR